MEENQYNKELESLKTELDNIEAQIRDIEYDMYGDYEEDRSYEDENEMSKHDRLSSKRETIKNQIQEIHTRIAIEKYNDIYKNKKNKYKRGLIVDDKETVKDLLSREIHSKIFAEYITNRKTDTPFNIGIFGQWGEGKSSFMRLIEKEIDDQNQNVLDDSKYYTHIVRYDASEYNEQDKIWSSILKKLFDKFEAEMKIKGKICFNFTRSMRKLKKNYWKCWISVISVLVVIVWGILIKTLDIKGLGSYIYTGIIPLLMLISSTIIPLIKTIQKLSKPLSDQVVVNLELPNYKKELGLRENIKEDLKDLLDVWLKKTKDKKYKERLVIFVDELDRCSDKGITEFFEAMQLFLPVEHIVIILSITYDSVYHALMKKYDYINKESSDKSQKIKFCTKYLEKYINIPFYLHNEGNYKEYINKLLDISQGNEFNEETCKSEVAATKILEESIDKDSKSVFEIEEKKCINELLNDTNKFINTTPREIKRILNLLVLSKHICITFNTIELYNEKINFANFISWFIFSYFNKKTSAEILSFIKRQPYYMTMNQLNGKFNLNEGLKTVMHEEIHSRKMLKNLKDIKVNEVLIFKDISEYFIINEESFTRLLL